MTYIFLSSIYRDITFDPFVNKFTNNIKTPFKNVSSIEVVKVTLPNTTAIDSLGVLFLVLNDNINLNNLVIPNSFNSSQAINKAFCAIPVTGSSSTNFISADMGENSYKIELYPPRDISNKFFIELRDLNGNLINFGESAGDLAFANQINIILKLEFN